MTLRRRARRFKYGKQLESDNTKDADLWWEWTQKYYPLNLAGFSSPELGATFPARFHMKQPLIGVIVLILFLPVAYLAMAFGSAWLVLWFLIYAYERLTLKDRARSYNRELWVSLVAEYGPDTKLKQPEGT